MNKDVSIDDLLKIKSEIICKGIKHNEISESIYDIEHKTKVKRTSNMGLQLLLTDEIIVSIPYGKENDSKSTYYLFEEGNKLFLTNERLLLKFLRFL